MTALHAGADALIIRRARSDDLPGIVACLADDEVGGHGDLWTDETGPFYEAAFREIVASGRDVLLVAELNGEIAGTAQVTFDRVIADRGALSSKLRTVFVREAWRGRSIGKAMVREAERLAHERGAFALSLVSNKKRLDAHRFYERLGYDKSHEGFRKRL